MRISTILIALVLFAWQSTPAWAQNVASAPPPAPNSQNSARLTQPSIGARAQGAHAANAATDGFLSRYRYQNGRWWYWGPRTAPAWRQRHELPENELQPFGQQNNNYFGAPAISRYSTGYGAHWSPYRGFDYGYRSGFGQNYYGFGNSYRGYGNGFYGYGYGVFSNGAYSTGD